MLDEKILPSDFKKIVVLTGAGISAESGLNTFRASDGLWENHRIEDVASPEGFQKNPDLVQHFYNERRKQLLDPQIKPNLAHLSLAEFEKLIINQNGDFLLITQNIDNLHEVAGSQNIIHIHGELFKVRCQKSGKVFTWKKEITKNDTCPCCKENNQLRPHVVWFGEMPLKMEEIQNYLFHCDLFISIGTSGNVYPAAGFCQLAKAAQAITVELNLEPSLQKNNFDYQYYGPATEIVPKFFNPISN